MLTQLKNFLAPPVFADEEQTRQARLLYFMLIFSALGIALASLAFILFVDGLKLNTITGVILSVSLFTLIRFVRQGHIKTIGWLMGGALFLGFTFAVWGAQGVRSAGMTSYVILLIIASVVLGQRAVVVFGGLTVLAVWGLYFVELNGRMQLQPLDPLEASARLALFFTLLTILTTGLLRSATHSFSLGFQRARERAAELEAKVQARTAELQAANLQLQHELQERQHIEATLRASEEKFSMVFRANPIGMGITRLSDNRLIEVNNAFTTISGYARDEALGRTALELQLYPNAATRAQAMTLLQTQGFLRDFEVSFQRKTGQSGVVLMSAELIELHSEPHSLFSVHDITARKQAEAALRESEERLRLALTAARMGTWDWDMSSGKITWSDQIPAIIGHPLDELTSTYDTYLNLISAQDRADTMRVVAELPNNQLTELTFEHCITWLDGSLHWLEGKAHIYRDELGKPVRMRGTLTDISARKQAEAALRTSEEMFNKAFHSSPSGMVISRAADGRYLEVNEAFCAMTGYSRAEVIGRTSLELGVWSQANRTRALELLSRQGSLREHAVQFQKKSGEMGFVLLAAETIELSGEPCLIISHHDITTRKRAEEALRASEEKFHKVFHASPIGITLSRFSDGRYLEVNEAFCAMTGYSRAEVIGRTSLELGVWAKPEERAQLLARLTTQGFVRDYEASFRKQSGELGLVTLAVESITVNGEQCILVATQDITARKQAEDTLRRYTTRLEILREIDSAILTARSPEEIAAAALQGIRQLVPCLRATVSLFDFQAQQLFILVNSVKGETRFPTGARIPLAAIGDVTDLRQGRPRLIPDLLTFTPRTVVDEQLLLEGVRARLLLPLQFHGGLVGALVLSAGEPNVYTPEHIEIAAEVADQLAIAIQQARLYAETSEALRREQQLNEVAHTISSTLDLPTLLRQVVRLAVELVGAGESSMAVLSPNGEMFAYTFNYRADVSPQVVPKGTGLAWDIVAIGKPILLADYKTHPKALPAWINAGVQAFLGVPLIAGETVLGVLGLFHMTSERRFTERDVALAESIGQQAGVAIRNAQLFEATQRQLTELTVLQAVATVGAAVESEDDLLMYATPIISHAFLQEQCGVLLLNENRSGLYVHPSSRGISAERMQDLVPLGQGITGTVAASGQLMRVPDVRLEPVYRASTPETLSELCVPLKGSSQVLGVINVESPSLNAFSEADERLLVAVAGQLATALERLRAEQALRRLNAELERRVALLTALHENGLDLSTQLDLSELLHTIVERLMRLEGVTMSVLYLAEPQRTRLKLVVSHGLAPTYLVSYLNEGQGIGGQVFQRGELLVVPDYSQWPERVIDGPELPYRSVLGMPIKWRGQVLGVINLLDERVGRFGQPEIEMARLFADQAAAAILNAQLFEATRRQLSELTVLQAVAQAGTESETEASLLERVMLTIGDTLFHGRGSIMLLDTSAGVLRMAAAARAVSEESKRYVVPLGRGITGTVAQRGQPWRVPDVRQEPTYVAGGAMTLSELCVPLKVGEHVLGVINIESAQLDAFSEADERLLLTLAGQLAPAIERLRAEAALRQLNAELEQRVQERTAQLEAANKELEAFSYSVSHDLRSPLRSIDGFSQALLEDYEDQLDVDGQDYLRRVRAATQRMGQLIDDLLNLSRITRAELRQELVDLSALAQGVVAELQHAEPQRVVEVVIAAGLHGQGDARLLQIVLANLLGNAWKFTSKQTQARIELGAVVRDGHTTYFVRDNGAGFDMAYASKLFGAFQRLHALTEYSGTGIGLAIVQRIIHRHGGHVWAEGAVGQGATFYFTLTESNITGANHGGQNYFAG